MGRLDIWIEGYDTAQYPLVIAPYAGYPLHQGIAAYRQLFDELLLGL